MTSRIQTFVEYLLDTETTSEICFSQAIQKHNELFHAHHRTEFEQVITYKLQQWRDTNRTDQGAVTTITSNTGVEPSESSSEEEETSSSDDAEETSVELGQKIVAVALQQISSHLSEVTNDDDKRKRLVQCLPSDMSSSATPESHQPILTTIKSLLSNTSKEQDPTTYTLDDIDILYPYSARFLDAHQDFRDSTHYFIDGDSLLLSVAHHAHVDLASFHGNTLHVIFIIERILLTLFNQAHEHNYTLVFFDCNYELYAREAPPILGLLRACLISHLCKNVNKCGLTKVRQFNSWLDNDYLVFARDEKPLFIFYHDMSSLNNNNENALLSEDVLRQLLFIYRLFGNYHQYSIFCHLYLMNKLILTDTTAQCFQIKFNRICSMKLLEKFVKTTTTSSRSQLTVNDRTEVFEKWCQKTGQSDVRLFVYFQSILSLIEDKTGQQDEKLFKLLIPLLLLHVALLVRLSLADRHLPSLFPSVTFSPILSQLIIQFQQRLTTSLSSNLPSTPSWSKVADLFDGRLFVFTIHQMNQSKIHLDSNTFDIVKESLTVLNLSSSDNTLQDVFQDMIQSKDIICSPAPSERQSKMSKQQHQKIRHITNPLVDTYLKPILSSNNEPTFDLVDPADCQASIIGMHTKNYAYFTLYGHSLTSRDIKDSQLQIVLPTASTPAPTNIDTDSGKSTTATASHSADGKNKKQQHKKQPKMDQQTKAQKIIEENKQRKADKRLVDETDKMATVEARIKQIPLDNWPEAIDLLDKHLVNFETPTKRLQLLKRKFDLQRKYLRALKKKNILTDEEKSKLNLLQISYFATMTEMAHLENIVDAFNEKKKFMEELVDDSALDTEKWYRFQLEKINSRLPRREHGIPDDRTPDFIPDKWQVEFLDAVDKRQSIIIVAPTASGKTYASYYAMNKVLKDDLNAVCVYIAPTKALVNQVAATVYSRFGAVFGIFTRDYRMNMDTCRILVTVPECLEMLLLTPANQRWCKRIQYAIFDEIHCMSGEIGSDVWGRTMSLINCSMIGLSATVNNGEDMCRWLQSIEERRAVLFKTALPGKVCFIAYYERMADLNKYLYTERQLYPLHPVGLMNAKQLTTRGVPKDFSLSPCETLLLNDAMQKLAVDINSATTNGDMEHRPIPTLTEHFAPAWVTERSACNAYSRVVCNQFDRLIANKQNSVIDSIATSLSVTTSNKVHYPEPKRMSTLIVEFLLTLKEKNLLPCIVFSESRTLCEELAASVADYFEEIERGLRQTKYKNQIETLQKRMKQIEKSRKVAMAKKMAKSSAKRALDDYEDGDNNATEMQMIEDDVNNQAQLSGHEQDLLNGVLEEGTLANRHGCDRELVETLLKRASWENPRLVGYMKRGVAYHHPGLNNKGRVAVEALFRNRYVQIIFSTWTLALGIHMPTKTVAFAKDSIDLDALRYRQSSGRAGRRGFDVEGHIVFLDIPLSKIRHLTISAIPNIHAHFSTTVTFLMRLLYLCSYSEDSKDAINRSLVALECPFIGQMSGKKLLIDIQVRFHCLHTLDFLHRLNLINKYGDPIGLAGILSHLHDFEPANILLVYLMDTCLFHGLENDDDIVTVLAYLFTNTPWLITHKQHETLSSMRRHRMYNSKLFLPSISNEFQDRLQSYNSVVKDVYGFYIENVTRRMRSLADSQENVLPFSNISFARSTDYDNGTFEYDLHHHYSQQSQNPSISPFAGPSGLTHQRFMSVYNPAVGSWDLAYDLNLSPRIVPFVDVDCRDHTNSAYHLNSYALDFFKHGSEKLLIDENQLLRGETYSLLSDFLLVLSSVKKSLEIIVAHEEKLPKPNDMKFFLSLAKKMSGVQQIFSSKHNKQYPSRNKK
ncbi:unnamed protein product [Didymodactylos carnosus]|uniref:Uncharacterized protein n=1 Tax=Didymodactylos carnosus TaxID=1234261 RepID=A0A8S2GXF9_9BILA|nr:unnamed protein product [Didymodactylos carnosus]CAF3564205.1 unnamed protein product [Didymodactylos carnosus]